MGGTNLERARADFADDIRIRGGIKTMALVEGLATVPREAFLGPGPWRVLRAADMAPAFDQYADEFVDRHHKGERSAINRPTASPLREGQQFRD